MTVTRVKGGAIRSVSSEGHSGYAENGNDIVCAAVSSLMQALWIGLDEIIGAGDLKTARDSEIPLMSLEWDPEISAAQLIARVIVRSLEAVAESYPGHVKYGEIIEK